MLERWQRVIVEENFKALKLKQSFYNSRACNEQASKFGQTNKLARKEEGVQTGTQTKVEN